jgi:hypothetical protein
VTGPGTSNSHHRQQEAVMSYPYGPPPQWQPPQQWQPPPPRPPVSGTATATLVVAVASIPAGFFGLFWLPAVAAFEGPGLAVAIAASFILAPQILGYVALREIRQGRAHPISRQRAILGMAISGVYLMLALGIGLTMLTGG